MNRQKTTVKKKITYFLKDYVASLFTFLKMSSQFAKFLPLGVQMKGFETFCILFVLSSIHSIGIFFFVRRKCVALVVILDREREETFAVSLKNRKSCVCIKYSILVRPRNLIAMNFTFFILDAKCA